MPTVRGTAELAADKVAIDHGNVSRCMTDSVGKSTSIRSDTGSC